MASAPSYQITRYFSRLVDPRVSRTRHHEFVDILMIALCAMICGADDFVAMADFGLAKKDWFATFLALPHGIPSHDTFNRVFARMDPLAFSECFTAWTQQLQKKTKGRIIAFDGKKIRRSFDQVTGKSAIHMVSAWTSQNSLVLGQVKVDAKSNEITAIPRLLKLLDIEDSIVTIDAMGTQKEIARLIREKQAHYVLALKDNHPNLCQDVELFLNSAIQRQFTDEFGQSISHTYSQSLDKDHGRLEIRHCWCTAELEWLEGRHEWAGLKTIAVVEAHRTQGEKTSVERRYYLSSLPAHAKRIAQAVRAHWGIENRVHWILDMSFDEDRSRAHKDHAAQNLATLRHLTLNMLKNETSKKMGINRKRNLAGWDEQYLTKIITQAKEQ